MLRILEQINIVEGFKPVDLQDGANTGDWVSLKKYGRIAIVFMSAVGTDGDDPTLTLQQAQDVSGTGAKALNPSSSSPANVFKKQAATDLSSTGAWTDAVADVSTNTVTNTDAAEQDLIWVVEFSIAELDVTNGFDCVRATVADVGGNAQLGCLFYLLGEPRSPEKPEDMASAIVD